MYPKLILKHQREKSILHRHPWIFSGAVQTLPEAENGDIIEIKDSKVNHLGYGFFSPNSQIICRMFEFGKQEIIIDEAYWIHKIQSAYLMRKAFVISGQTNAYRLLHAEGDFLPGVIVDVYDKVAVMQLLIRGTEKIYASIIQGIKNLGITHIYLKTKENSHFLEAMQMGKAWLTDAFEGEIIVLENGLKFPIDIEKGQKTGFFIDQRESRNLLKSYSKDKNILNAFSYTGGFSAYALAGGANSVHSVDISKDAIEVCDKTIQMNFGSEANHQSFAEDCFDFLKKIDAPYDLIVLDPPAFAKNKKSVTNAIRGYISLNELGLRKVKSGGLIFTFSCSGNIDKDTFRKAVFTASSEAGRNVRILHQLTQPADHPINIYHPEGEYLKGLVLYVE